MSEVKKALRRKTEEAMDFYHKRYGNGIYTAATEGASGDRCNALLDSAMALCGHPRLGFVDLDWGDKELGFLALFVD